MIKIEITDLQNMDSYTLKETGLYLMCLSEREDRRVTAHNSPDKYNQLDLGQPEKPAEYSPPEEPEAPELVEPPSAAEIFSKSEVLAVQEDTEISDVFNNIHKKVTEATNEEHKAFLKHMDVGIVPPAPERFEVLGTAEAGAGVLAPVFQDIEEKYRYGVEIDADGLPWDSRIHTRTKSKTASGRWKIQRGMGGSVVKKIEEELRAAQGIPSPEPQPAPPVVLTPAPQPAPTPPPLEAAPTPPPFPTLEKAFDFADLMTIVTSGITAGRLTREQVVEVLTPYGIPSLPVVATRPDLIPAVIIALKGVINAPR